LVNPLYGDADRLFAHHGPEDLDAFRLPPHRTETFKLSSDLLFVDKVRDIVGLYLPPPGLSGILCVWP
jgi:hypothetical protein